MIQDIGTFALLALLFVPFYFLLNQYWRSLVLLGALYLLLSALFCRLGSYFRRVMRRQPAEIPPWHTVLGTGSTGPDARAPLRSSEALEAVAKDPLYLQEVLKPRLRQFLAYRLSGSPDVSFEELDASRLARLDPALLDFLTRREATGLWATYRYRRQRVHHVLAALHHIEAV
jgi:hypothetical protein